ncbi:MAG: PASTA domain-containing protein, partial [Bacteroidetes bacterium]
VIPIEGSEEDPKDGADITTTIDINVQDVAQEALRSMMESNEALNGTCIVMEVKTGKIRAMANLGRMPNGTYAENYNYALSATEPGSTWKLVTLLSVLEDQMVSLNSSVNLEGGRWNVAGETVFDSEPHSIHEATVLKAFEKSSNVGMAKLVYQAYYKQPSKFINRIKALHLDSITGIDLPGEGRPSIYKPGSKSWSNTTALWMGFGYNLTISPLATAMLYNAVANRGKMMRPYLVSAISKDGAPIKTFEPVVLNQKICSDNTLKQLQISLESVVTNGTGHKLLTPAYAIAGKTGTSLVADKNITYKDKMYQSSFAGYMPANNPQYTIVVVIRNKAHAAKFYGADVAGPVFRRVSDELFASCQQTGSDTNTAKKQFADTSTHSYIGKINTLKKVLFYTGISRADEGSVQGSGTLMLNTDGRHSLKPGANTPQNAMPTLAGLGLKDAVSLCESRGLNVSVQGKGKVQHQSIAAGTAIQRSQTIHLQLQ